MTKSKKIVFLGFLPGFGGAEKAMIMTANGLVNKGHIVSIVSLKDNNVVYPMDDKVNYIFLADLKGSKIKKIFKRFTSLKRTLIQIKPEIVISFWLQPAILSVILSKYIGFKTVYSERGDPSDREYSGLLGFLRNIFFNFMNGFVFQTEAAKKYFSTSIQKRSTVINNPVYIKYEDYSIPLKRRKTIVNVGRLHEQKNQNLLIAAFNKVSNLFPEYTLEIYGDGLIKENLLSQIKQLQLEERVILKGTTDNLNPKIMDASLFVLSSLYEGMPNALMEAMALGIPCITTNYRPYSAKELIVNGGNGLIVENNSVNELAQAMKHILTHPEEATVMGIKAKDICKTHSKERIIMMWEEYILRLVEEN